MREHTGLKAAISIAAGALLAGHLIWPAIKVDAVTVALLLVAVLPWAATLIRSAELPGGWKIEFQDVKAAGEKVTSSVPHADSTAPASEPAYLAVATRDPNLALVGLRLEIESRVRALAAKYGVPDRQPLRRTLNELVDQNVLHPAAAEGLKELIAAGSDAAHGARVDPRTAAWALSYGPKVLAVLDNRVSPPAP